MKIKVERARSSAMAIAALVFVVAFWGLFGQPRIQRYGMVIGVKPEKIEAYKTLHAAAWRGVLKKSRSATSATIPSI